MSDLSLSNEELIMFFKRRFILALAWGFCSAHNNVDRFKIAKIVDEYVRRKLQQQNVIEKLDTMYADVTENSHTLL